MIRTKSYQFRTKQLFLDELWNSNSNDERTFDGAHMHMLPAVVQRYLEHSSLLRFGFVCMAKSDLIRVGIRSRQNK